MTKSRFPIIAIAAAAIFIAAFAFSGKRTTPPEANALLEYRNNPYGFALKHPRNISPAPGPDPQYNTGTFLADPATSIVTFPFPEHSYPGTNFIHAFLTIAANDKNDAVSCRVIQREGDETPRPIEGERSIGGVSFAFANAEGAAAGTLAKSRVYHAFANGRCFEINLTLLTGNIGNYYEPGAVEEINEREIWDTLDEILKTVSFDA